MNSARIRPLRLILVGSILVDILMYVDHLPERGGDTMARRTLLTSGGGFNVLTAAARLGLPAAYAGLVGDGPMGNQIKADLAAANIPLLLPGATGADTGFDIGMVEPDGERTFVTTPGIEARLTSEDLQAIPLLPGDVIYVSGYDLCYPISGRALEQWLPTLSDRHLLIIDPGPLVANIPALRLERILARTDLLSPNARETSILSGSTNIAEGASILAYRIAPDGWIIARAGAQGCWIANRTTPPIHLPPRPARVIDTTGAGDSHVGALLANLARGDDMQAAAHTANVAASLSVEKSGPATGPTCNELEAACSLLQKTIAPSG
jgi:sugar/nucleoside kinase (ribokinase family)